MHTRQARPAPSLFATLSDDGKRIVKTVRGDLFGIWNQAPSTSLVWSHWPDSRVHHHEAE